jgi:polysaccharide biosynthesis/export protein
MMGKLFMPLWLKTVALLPLFFLANCTGLPAGGPGTRSILENPTDPKSNADFDYTLIEVAPATVQVLARNRSIGLSGAFGSGASPITEAISVGDQVTVTIFESSTGGLFGASTLDGLGTKSTTLPQQVVDGSGRITVPFAGRVKAAGRNSAQVEKAIERALDGKAVDPQVIVTSADSGSRLVTVSGEVGQGGRYKIGQNGNRILDAIGLAGGPKGPAHQMYVRLTRGTKTSKMKLSALLETPKENIFLRPGDQVFIYREPKTITVLGATSRNTTLELQREDMTLAEILGEANGLNDQRSDPAGVFVFRFEDGDTLAKLGHPELGDSKRYPTVYHMSLTRAQGLFLSQSFLVENQDILYISNAPATDASKFLQLLGQSVGVVNGGLITKQLINP